MRYGILGQLDVRNGTGTVPLAHGRARLLLAVLLVHADQPVSSDRLIDALWGENPPPSAVGSLHNLVSALRKSLGDGGLVTHARGGYQLNLDGDELDAALFDALSSDGRDALAAGDPERAARLLADALALWRGPVFGELAYESALQAYVARLEELRVVAIEDRIDADLALGRHAQLVGELEALVVEQPLRERLRGQLILALYRSGRQADALSAYADARRHLVDELGIEPSPALRKLERAVLEQDPALDPPRPRRPLSSPSAASPVAVAMRHPWRLAAVGALLVATAIAAVMAAGGSQPPRAGAAALTGDLLVAIDAATGRLAERVVVGGTPTSVTVGGGAVWTLNTDDRTISRVDLKTKAARVFSTERPAVDLAADDDALWVAQATPRTPNAASFDLYALPTSVTRIDPQSGVARSATRLRLPSRSTLRVPPGELLTVGGGAVWAITREGWVQRVDIETGRLIAARSHRATAIAAGAGQLWTYDDARRGVVRLDPRTGRKLYAVPIAAESVDALAVGAGAVWVTDTWGGVVWRVDPELRSARTIKVQQGVDRVAVGAGAVWVASSVTGTISRIDPRTERVTATVRVPGTPRGLAVGGGRVWVSVANAGGALPASGGLAPGARVQALPGPPCGGVIAGRGGDPDYLIAADLALGTQRESTVPMSEAIAFVLRQHGFRAGRFTLGLQTCDDASTETGIWDVDKCRHNAALYARNKAILGVVGAMNSGCSERMLPILNRAPGGPPALVSPANSDPELVRREPARRFDAMREVYPTGQRAYARPWPSDDTEVAAGVLVAKQHAAGGSVYYLEDRDFTARTFTWTWFRRAADRTGLTIAGRDSWPIKATNHRALAARVRKSGARVVYVAAGGSAPSVGSLARDLRDALGPDATIVSGGLLPISLLFASAGPSARGMLITSQGLTPDRLGPRGRRFVREFGATQPGGQVATLDVYAAAATEILLDAIARSDGTRESVARALKNVHLSDSVIGPLSMDSNGEPTSQPITVLRAEHGGGRQDITLGIDGSTIVDVITPPAELVGPAAR